MEQSPCDAFQKNDDGTWTSIKAAALQVENKKITIPEGMTFKQGEEFMFVDVAEWLEKHCS